MSLGTILIILLIFMLVGGLPRWGYHDYNYGPSSIVGVVLVVVVLLLLMGRL